MFKGVQKEQSTLYKMLYILGVMSVSKSVSGCSVLETVADSDLVKCQLDDLIIKYSSSRKTLSVTNTASTDTEPFSISMFFRQYMYIQHPSKSTAEYSLTIDEYLPAYDENPPQEADLASPYRGRQLWLSPKETLFLYYLFRLNVEGYSTNGYQNSTLESPNDSLELTQFRAVRKESCGLEKVIRGGVSANIVGDLNDTKTWAIDLSTSSSTMYYKFPDNCTTKEPTNPPTILNRLQENESELRLAS